MYPKLENGSKAFLGLLLVGLFLGLFITPASAQDWRASAGYMFKSYSTNYIKNPSFTGEVSPIQKGVLQLEVERYLFYGVYIAGQSEFVVQNDADSFFDGPATFQQANFSSVLGYQWPKWGAYGGIEGGRIWDIRFRGIDANDNTIWIKPQNTTSAWTTSLKLGLKYYVLSFLRLHLEYSKVVGLPEGITAQPTPEGTSQLNAFDFDSNNYTVGVALSIPWNSKKYNRNSNRDIDLPELRDISEVTFSSPLADGATITSRFGSRWGHTHEGVDLDADRGDPVEAAADGVVVIATRGTGYGKMIKIKHGAGYSTVYAHLSKVNIKKGEKVKRGDVIGKAGSSGTSTGPHLHFEIIENGVHQNPQAFILF